jgi:hypothetical protein
MVLLAFLSEFIFLKKVLYMLLPANQESFGPSVAMVTGIWKAFRHLQNSCIRIGIGSVSQGVSGRVAGWVHQGC